MHTSLESVFPTKNPLLSFLGFISCDVKVVHMYFEQFCIVLSILLHTIDKK